MPADPEMMSVVSFHWMPAPRSTARCCRSATTRRAPSRYFAVAVWRPTSLNTKPMPASPV